LTQVTSAPIVSRRYVLSISSGTGIFPDVSV
jgi:hypothetical protein